MQSKVGYEEVIGRDGETRSIHARDNCHWTFEPLNFSHSDLPGNFLRLR